MKPKEQKLLKVTALFIDKISGLAFIIILNGCTYSTILIKLKFTHNATILDIVNNGTETIIGIVDLRSLGYYRITQGILQQNLSKCYRFKRAETLCEYFNKFTNTLKNKVRQKIQQKIAHG